MGGTPSPEGIVVCHGGSVGRVVGMGVRSPGKRGIRWPGGVEGAVIRLLVAF